MGDFPSSNWPSFHFLVVRLLCVDDALRLLEEVLVQGGELVVLLHHPNLLKLLISI